MKSAGNFILEFVQSIVLALSVFVLLYLLVAQPNEVKGSSMVPSFINGEYLLTDKLSYRFRDPKRGEVVVFKAPPSEPCAEDECEYIKRIIGVPGDKVEVRQGKVYLNRKPLNEVYLAEGTYTENGAALAKGRVVIVSEGEYLLFGDNRPHSRDGREFGKIDKSLIVGRAFFRYWPASSLGMIPDISI